MSSRMAWVSASMAGSGKVSGGYSDVVATLMRCTPRDQLWLIRGQEEVKMGGEKDKRGRGGLFLDCLFLVGIRAAWVCSWA